MNHLLGLFVKVFYSLGAIRAARDHHVGLQNMKGGAQFAPFTGEAFIHSKETHSLR